MDYYVLLTGGKNNAGDFLIKHRAKNLLKEVRPDRAFKDFNAWEKIDDEKLEVVNNAKALILTGGPALQKNMYPGIYQLRDSLDDIRVPIMSMGIGWKSASGNWENIYDYQLNSSTKKLIARIAESGFSSSVRDYHTMHVLQREGMNNVLMTGCPALYDADSIGKKMEFNNINKVLFSLGVSFARSKAMRRQVKEIVLSLKGKFKDSNLTIMFHHSIDEDYLKTPDASDFLYRRNVEFSDWLDTHGIDYKDISGSADDLIKEYSKADLHIGYRVHAHIFMSSISKPSILIAEDGRGKALRALLGGVIFDGYSERKTALILRGLNRINLPVDLFDTPKNLPDLLIKTINYEIKNNLPRLKATRESIDNHYPIMEKFISQLP
jgi:hypothetical protein